MAGSWPGLWISLILSCLIQVEEFKKNKKGTNVHAQERGHGRRCCGTQAFLLGRDQVKYSLQNTEQEGVQILS